MSKLVCTEHGRRVMVLPTTTVVHREDGRPCETPLVRQRTKTHTPKAVAERTELLNAGMQTAEGRLLLAIFGKPDIPRADPYDYDKITREAEAEAGFPTQTPSIS